MTDADDNKRLRAELRIVIAEREVARKALGEIAYGTVADPKAYAADAFQYGLGVRGRIEGAEE